MDSAVLWSWFTVIDWGKVADIALTIMSAFIIVVLKPLITFLVTIRDDVRDMKGNHQAIKDNLDAMTETVGRHDRELAALQHARMFGYDAPEPDRLERRRHPR